MRASSDVRKWYRAIGRKGGKARTAAKVRAGRRNVAKARAAKALHQQRQQAKRGK